MHYSVYMGNEPCVDGSLYTSLFFLFTYLDLELTNENITVQKIKF